VGNLVTRPAQVADIPGLARLHVESWRETFRGLFSDAVLDDPDAVERRERFWTAALTDERYSKNTAATATLDGKVVGLAMSGPALDEDATWESQLYVLYTYASVHGRGAGSALLNAVNDPGAAAGLWVVDPSPRAQAFYRKHGFEPDGRHRVDDGVRVIRMTRPPR
jgi:ribosomal protein S18 acetylase RimI-like enzyme